MGLWWSHPCPHLLLLLSLLPTGSTQPASCSSWVFRPPQRPGFPFLSPVCSFAVCAIGLLHRACCPRLQYALFITRLRLFSRALVHSNMVCVHVCVVSVVSDSLRPMDCSPPGSSVLGISQARILEGVALSFPRGSS